MNKLPSKIELSMYAAVLQAQTALGGILQRGLGIQIDSVECLEPYPWNKLEIPERLNGEGITIAIMDQQGGYLLFISDDGILLPAGYVTTLNDPTQPLPVMANQLQKEILPDAPDYVGKRIGKAKVFSSMARRAGVDNSAQILPIKLVIGDQESLIWFIGSVPHPDRAFAKRNPTPESKSKKSKLFSDEILSNFTVSSDFLDPPPDCSQPIEDTPELLDESCSEINNKPERHKADLGRLLALKSTTVDDNYEWQTTGYGTIIENNKNNIENEDLSYNILKDEQEENVAEQDRQPLLPISSDEKPVCESNERQQDESDVDQTVDSTYQSSLLTASCPIDLEQDVVIVQGDAIPDDIIPEFVTSEDIVPETVIPEFAIIEDNVSTFPEDDVTEGNEAEDDIQEDNSAENDVTEQIDSENVIQEDIEEFSPEETNPLASEFVDGEKRYTLHAAHINYPVAHGATPPLSHAALKMPVTLDAVISHRRYLIQEILSWKPGSVIEFDEIQTTVTLESNGVVLGRGKPIEQNLRIGVQLE